VTTKYDPDGSKLWQRFYDTFATDLITSAATDNAGAVYVGGSSTNPFSGQTQFIVIKYASDGGVLWQYSYTDIPGASTYLSKVLLDSSQNLLIFGSYVDPGSSESGLLTVKLDPGGNEIWSAGWDAGDYGYGAVDARLVADHIVFWAQNGSAEGLRFFAWQIDMNGQTIDTAHTEPYSDYFWIGYYTDENGSLYIGDNAGEYKVSKFGVNGISDWVYKKPVSFSNPDVIPAYTYSITTNNQGDVYISGGLRLTDSVGMIGLTSKLNSSGKLVWEHEFSLNDIEQITPYRVSWLKDGLLLVIGLASTKLDSNFYEYFLATYDPNGFVKGGISDIPGRRNWPASIAPDGAYFYIAGEGDPEIEVFEPSWQFLCKYSLEEVVSTQLPSMVSMVPEQLTLSPNPVRDKCRVSLDHTGGSTKGVLEISDNLGNIISSKEVFLTAGMNIMELEIPESLPQGVYGVVLRTAEKFYVASVVRMK